MNNDTHSPSFRIRRAIPADRAEMVQVLDTVFKMDLGGQLCHLFTDERIGDHFLAEDAGRIVGVTGLYPHQFRVGSVMFAIGGVGQVATLEEMRGRGVMAGILRALCPAADAFDFVWLGGDRQRYGRYGWEIGGVRYVFDTTAKYLPAPPPAERVRPFSVARDMARVHQWIANAPQTAVFPAREIDMMLATADKRGYSGWVLGGSFILAREKGTVIFMGDGSADELALLLAHAARELQSQPGGATKLTIEYEPDPTPLLDACRAHYWHMRIEPEESFRVGNLVSFLRNACAAAQPRVACGAGRVSFINSDNNQAATVVCASGRFSVVEGAGSDAYRLNTRDLSGVCFGAYPLDLLLPGLPADAPIRQVLPLRIGVNRVFWL